MFFHRFSLHAHGNHVSVMDQPVQDGVGNGRISNGVVLFVRGDLAGDDGGTYAMPIFQHLQDVAALFIPPFCQSPIVYDKERVLRQAGQKLAVVCRRRGLCATPEGAAANGCQWECKSVPPLGETIPVRGSGNGSITSFLGELLGKGMTLQPVAVALDVDHLAMVQKPNKDGRCYDRNTEEFLPV